MLPRAPVTIGTHIFFADHFAVSLCPARRDGEALGAPQRLIEPSQKLRAATVGARGWST